MFTVTNTNPSDGVAGSLGAAIDAANATSGGSTIVFNISGNGPFTIPFCTASANIKQSVVIDATTQPGYKGAPVVQLLGAPGNNRLNGFSLIAANAVTIRGFAITSLALGVYVVVGGNHIIEGNYIGTDLAGNIATGLYGDGSAAGVGIENSNNVQVGGTTAAARNVISGNLAGVITNVAATIQGNYIGVNAQGTSAVGNQNYGVYGAMNAVIGGTTAGAGNVISANNVSGQAYCGGVRADAAGQLVQGNYIGTNAAGTAALGNHGNGLCPGQIQVGGTTPAARNVISGNTGDGIGGGVGIVVQGNYVGTGADGVSPVGNAGHGVSATCCEIIGGTTAGAGNVIAFNGGAGVLTPPDRDFIRRNSIFSNATLGIDNGSYQDRGDGVTRNRNCAGTNFPVLTSAVFTAATTIAGTLNNDSNASVDIDLFGNASCDLSGYGQGHTYLGSTTGTTDSSCNASFDVALPLANWGEPFITATATNVNGPHPVGSSTSEFSECLLAPVPRATLNVGTTQSANPLDTLPASVRVVDSNGNPIAGAPVTFSVRHPPRSGWLDELGRLKGGRS